MRLRGVGALVGLPWLRCSVQPPVLRGPSPRR